MATVVVIEDHALLAETLRFALRAAGIETEVLTPAEAPVLLAALRRSDPELVLLDLDLGAHGDSTGLIAPLAAHGVRTLVVSGTADRERIALAFEAGAFGFHAKADGFDLLINRAVAALTSTEPLNSELRRDVAQQLAVTRFERSTALAPFHRLTERERATLAALADGRSVHDIASDWVVSEATVRSHVRGVLEKLDAPSQLAAVAMAMRCGWFSCVSTATR